MFLRPVLVSLLTVVTVFCCAPVFAGKVELTTYYPAPFGEYKELNSTGNTHLAQESGANVGIGTSTPQNKLDVAGSAVIGTNYAGANAAPADGLLVEGRVGIGTITPAAYGVAPNSHQTYLDVSGYAAADDIYLKNPVTGTPRWASQAVFGAFEEIGPVCVGPLYRCGETTCGCDETKFKDSVVISDKSFCALSQARTFVKSGGTFSQADDVHCRVEPVSSTTWLLSAWKNEGAQDPGAICRAICF